MSETKELREAIASSSARRVQPVPEQISILVILAVLLRHLKVVVLVPLTAVVLAVAITLAVGRNHVAVSAFIPETGDATGSRLSGLAAQFGFSLPMGGQGESAPFFARLLTSRELLAEAIMSDYQFEHSRFGDKESLAGNFIDLYQIKGDTHDQQLKSAIKRIRKLIDISVDRETRIITFAIRTPWPAFSVHLNNRLLELLNHYNLERRQTVAGAERVFVAKRLEEARQELLEAEAELETFLERNRLIQSPQLTFTRARLQRNVDLRHQVFTALAQAFEQARIEEVRNTPVIMVLEKPDNSTEPAPRLLLILLVSGLLGSVAALVIITIREYFGWRKRVAPDEYRDFQRSLSRISWWPIRSSERSSTSEV